MEFKLSFGSSLIFALALAEVTSWTIDLPEVRKYFFDKNKAQKEKGIQQPESVFYSNIEPNSKHHEIHDREDTEYAREYGYQSYMEKKVNGIVYNGSIYLEGLRRSLMNYTKTLENCTRTDPKSLLGLNITTPQSNFTLPPIDIYNSSKCREATRSTEHVRRLAELAMWSTRQLQDIAYSRTYNKGDPYDLTQEENELILKLAWFLDRIAHYTGYEPEPKDFLHTTTTTTTPVPPPPPMFVNPSEELKQQLMKCIKQKSQVPAVERCRYTGPVLPALQDLFDANDNATAVPTMPPLSTPLIPEDVTAEPSKELLIMADTSKFPLNPFRSKRSLSMPKPEVRIKREDPLLHFFKYYAKYKAWDGDNIKSEESRKYFEKFEVKNHLHFRQKREIDKRSKLPENPLQDLSEYVKHKSGVNYVKDEEQLEKIKNSLDKMHIQPFLSKFRQKRSLKYDKDVDLPRNSENPQGDISYYVKNKPGRYYNNDLIQAIQVRAGLEQVYNTGNIEVVRRYGSNFNPLVPSPFVAGVFRTMADF